MEFKSLSPVILVDAIEPCLAFWEERLEFTRTGEVPMGDRLGFVMLQRDNALVMYQTYASAEADIPGLVNPDAPPGVPLYFSVTGFDEIRARLDGVDAIVDERTTFYGARETFVRAPCGSIVGFAEMADEG